MDLADKGKKALQASQYDEAIALLTGALKVSPTSPDYLIQRSTAYHRKQQFDLALADAEQAVLAAQKRAKREMIVEAQFRRGCALWGLEKYADAEFVYQIVQRMDPKHKSVAMWLQKTRMKLKDLGEDDERRKVTVMESPEGELKTAEDGAKEDIGATRTQTNGNTANGSTISPPPAAPQQTPAEKIRHEWYQNSENIYFTLLAKGVPKDKAQVDIQERSLNISFPLATGSSFDLTLEPLFAAVKPDKCITRVMATKVEIILVKATPGQKWSKLESSEPIAADSTEAGAADTDDGTRAALTTNAAASAPAYPTSSKSGPKDWDAIARGSKATDKEGDGASLEDDDDYEGGDEANHFFKKLFKGASPEAQRAMMKSYTESNGTALSTDWSEVSKGKVETVPPDGMEAKKWSK